MLRSIFTFNRSPQAGLLPLIAGATSHFQAARMAFPQSSRIVSQQLISRTKVDFAANVQTSGKQSDTDINEEKRQKIIELEMDVLRQEGHRVPEPEFVTSNHWEQILSLKSKSARRKYYSYLWQVERKRENKEAKKEERKQKVEERRAAEREAVENNQHIIYGLGHTSFLLRIYDTTINHWNNNKLIQAMQFGPKLVFDCSYDEYMTKRESINAAKQLMLCFATNRNHTEPFDLHFCNVNFNSTTMHYLEKHIPTMREPEFPLNLHEECFTKVFPKEKLVYLTPHCKENLEEFNHDDVYIVGCMVDKVNNEPLSLAKAKKLGLRMARLPLDRYLQWKAGSGKSLTLNQMTDILLDVKKNGDWKNALRHVPTRKTFDFSTAPVRSNRVTVKKENLDRYKFNIDTWSSKVRKY